MSVECSTHGEIKKGTYRLLRVTDHYMF